MIKNAEAGFSEYEKLVKQVDKAFSEVEALHGDKVRCAVKCSDCCHALFDLSLIEAMYIKDRFDALTDTEKKEKILKKANRADRDVYRIKRKASQDLDKGKDEFEIMAEMSLERVRCPLLNDDDMCDLYESRPITCRLYGIPTSIGGRGHTCGMSGFLENEKYPTANLDAIHRALYRISEEYAGSVQSRHSKIAELLLPLSMALLTDYNDEYLGIAPEKKTGEKDGDSAAGGKTAGRKKND
ncbi:conserved hypothetical protein [Candidatus Desulfarcum epimagneticum]|uniref:Zinc/iron-chelating domain-containing protein n=1 Tax=uncultured Desulfobacteraceae bacterium TaxID=218296 RepID=A0A484HBD8_9BACT|nr:conserved hypothetical protein [uncultured Desulfobacteraceae bacterium]